MKLVSKFTFAPIMAAVSALAFSALPSLANLTAPGDVHLAECPSASAQFVTLTARNELTKGFAGSTQAALLVNSGLDLDEIAGVAFVPDYSQIPGSSRGFTDGTILFKDDGTARNNSTLTVCLGGAPRVVKLTSLQIVPGGNGWSEVRFNARDFATRGSTLAKVAIALNGHGNMTVGKCTIFFNTGPRGISEPDIEKPKEKDCKYLTNCPK